LLDREQVETKKIKKLITIEYDWEKPERTFFYKVPTDCKSFTYKFSIPSGVEIKNRALKVDGRENAVYVCEPHNSFGKKIYDKCVFPRYGKPGREILP
jgi:hypothetical protein